MTLVGLSNAPTAVRAAANCYCQLLVSQSDNNVKLIVLDRLVELKGKHREVNHWCSSPAASLMACEFDGIQLASSFSRQAYTWR